MFFFLMQMFSVMYFNTRQILTNINQGLSYFFLTFLVKAAFIETLKRVTISLFLCFFFKYLCFKKNRIYQIKNKLKHNLNYTL